MMLLHPYRSTCRRIAAAYVCGFMLSTLALLLAGLGAGWLLRGRALWLTRLAGAGIAAAAA